MPRLYKTFVLFLSLFTIITTTASADLPTFEDLKPIIEISELPEEQIDLARTLLDTEKIISPEVDVQWALDEINRIAERVKTTPVYKDSFDGILDGLTQYFYHDGEWNGFNKYEYDFDGYLEALIALREKREPPQGHKEPYDGSSLFKFLKTIRGNCFTMPLVFLLVGEKLGMKISMVQSPSHNFLHLHDVEEGLMYNYEATTGGFKRTSSYMKRDLISKEAVENGLYFRDRAKSEVLLDKLIFYGYASVYNKETSLLETSTKITDYVLNRYPKNIDAILLKGQLERYYAKETLTKKYRDDLAKALNNRELNIKKQNDELVSLLNLDLDSLRQNRMMYLRELQNIQHKNHNKTATSSHISKIFHNASSIPSLPQPKNPLENILANQLKDVDAKIGRVEMQLSKINDNANSINQNKRIARDIANLSFKEHQKRNLKLFKDAENLGWDEESEEPSLEEIEWVRKMTKERKKNNP